MLPADTRCSWPVPFRLHAEDSGTWACAHDELVDFFNLVLELMAETGMLCGDGQRCAAGDPLERV